MEEYKVITSMSASYYEKVGKYMLRSWVKNWSPVFHLYVYSEDNIPFEHERVHHESLSQFGEPLQSFLSDVHSNSRSIIFAKKAWPIMGNLKSSKGKLVWIDADVITEGAIYQAWLLNLIGVPSNFSAHFGVPQNGYYSVETGFFIIDRTHPAKHLFLEKYSNIYYTRDFSNMYKPFDGDTFGRCITECKKEYEGFSYNELSPQPDKILSPFNKVMKGKMWHLKAKHKEKDLENSPRMQAILHP